MSGARLPTGAANVKAVYRRGIGKGGNVRAGQITLLSTRPLGVKEVINPLRASGGADKEGRDQARRNTPLAVMALDRLVSTRDYADFARTFAGIGKALATEATDGARASRPRHHRRRRRHPDRRELRSLPQPAPRAPRLRRSVAARAAGRRASCSCS